MRPFISVIGSVPDKLEKGIKNKYHSLEQSARHILKISGSLSGKNMKTHGYFRC